MRIKRKIMFTAMLAFAAIPTFAGEPSGVHLFFADGSDKWFLFEQQPVVAFSDNELTVTTSDDIFAYTFDAVKEFRFGDPDSDRINDKQSAVPRIVQVGDVILVYGAGVNVISLYELSGRRLTANVRRQGDAVSISLQSLPTGVYIIRMNNQSIKVTKK